VEYTEDAPLLRRELESLLLPRGLTEKAVSVVSEAGSRLVIHENRSDPEPIEFAPSFQLREDQEAALRALRDHELGVLVAPPGSGKTVVACALISHHQRPTLIIVDRKPLVEQWTERLATHLGLTAKEIGQIAGAGTRRPVSSTSPWHRVLLDEKISTRYQTVTGLSLSTSATTCRP